MRPPPYRRPAKALVLFVLLLPVLMAWCGLTVDAGLLMAAHRQAQNAADAAAVAAANDLLAGNSANTALARANTYIQQYNGLADAPALVSGTTFNVPPTQGPYAGNSQYVEVIVQAPVRTYFVQAGGFGQAQWVQARAVAGYTAISANVGAAVLDKYATPGLSISGGGKLYVNGRVVVNSHAAGYDQNGQYVNLGYAPYAVATGNNSLLEASDVHVVGGVDTPANIQNLPGFAGSPLHAGELPIMDPLLDLPTPTAANGVVTTYWGLNSKGQWATYSSPQNVSVSVSGQSVTFSPGIYQSITVQGGSGSVTFNPGVYVLVGGSNSTLSINGGATITGNGVMFYNTGSDYSPSTGLPDAGDGDASPAPPASTTFGSVGFNASNIQLTPLADTSSPFKGMLLYQRRWNTNGVSIQGNGSQNLLGGTLYAKWANFKLAGQGQYNAQYIAGSISVSGQANVTINYANQVLGKANHVFLVE